MHSNIIQVVIRSQREGDSALRLHWDHCEDILSALQSTSIWVEQVPGRKGIKIFCSTLKHWKTNFPHAVLKTLILSTVMWCSSHKDSSKSQDAILYYWHWELNFQRGKKTQFHTRTIWGPWKLKHLDSFLEEDSCVPARGSNSVFMNGHLCAEDFISKV